MKKFKSAIALLLALIMVASCGMAAFAADGNEATGVEEKESNNDYETANEFKLLDTVKGRLGVVDDVDYFSLDVNEAGIALITFTHEVKGSSSTYFTVEVFGEDEKKETEFSVVGSDEKTFSTSFGVKKGYHYVKVSKGQIEDTTLEYRFTMKVDTDARAEKEPNNSAATASEMDLSLSNFPKRYLGNLSDGDEDYFVVNVPRSGFIYPYIYNTNGKKGEYKLTVSTYVEGENGIAELRNLGSIYILNSEESVMGEPIGVSQGRYYAKIEGTIGGYETRIFFSESAETYESEYNNNFMNPDSFVIGKTIKGSLYDENDVDTFKFSVTKSNKNNKLVVTPEASAKTTSKWTVTVSDIEGTAIKTVDCSSAAPAEIALNDFEAGSYYVSVSTSKSYHDASRYTISTVKNEEKDEKNLSFIDRIKAIDWSKFLNSFKGWLGKIDFIGITKSIYQSIKTIMGMIDL